MEKIGLDKNWFRHVGYGAFTIAGRLGNKKAAVAGPYGPESIPDVALPVRLPDDFCISMERKDDQYTNRDVGFFQGGLAKYWCNLFLKEEWKDKRLILDFDGVYMNSEYFINGYHLGKHPYGYTPFHIDINDGTVFGQDNILRVDIQADHPNNRWYAGGGIYRDVHLYIADKVYIRPWNMFIKTPTVGKHSIVECHYFIENDLTEDKEIKICLQVFDEETVVAKTDEIFFLKAKEALEAVSLIEVDDCRLWSVEEPNLYRLQSTITLDDETIDEGEYRFGIREIQIDSVNGFRLNGKEMKLYGGCLHCEKGSLGLKDYRAAEKRRLMKLKELGFNAIRTSHNPPSETFLNLCDELGLLVLDETFDTFLEMKSAKDYHLYFENWWEKDLTLHVQRERNHPCVWCYSLGNEIKDLYKPYGVEYAKKIVKRYHELDDTRPVMSAVNGMSAIGYDGKAPDNTIMFGYHEFDLRKDGIIFKDKVVEGEADPWGDQTKDLFELFDIAGQNYMHRRAEHDHDKFPERIIVTTESCPYDILDAWDVTKRCSALIGNFAWNAADFIGEAGMARTTYKEEDLSYCFNVPFPWITSFQGDLDLALERKPQSFYRSVVWGLEDLKLFVTRPEYGTGRPYTNGWSWDPVVDDWTFDEKYIGEKVRCSVYTNGDRVEFYLNDKKVSEEDVRRKVAEAIITYEPGTLKAIAYKDGRKIGEDTLVTTGEADHISLEKETIEDLTFIKVKVCDKQGRLVKNKNYEISVHVQDGELIGLDSGNPCTAENYGTGKRFTYNGILIATIDQGIVEFNCPELTGAKINIERN